MLVRKPTSNVQGPQGSQRVGSVLMSTASETDLPGIPKPFLLSLLCLPSPEPQTGLIGIHEEQEAGTETQDYGQLPTSSPPSLIPLLIHSFIPSTQTSEVRQTQVKALGNYTGRILQSLMGMWCPGGTSLHGGLRPQGVLHQGKYG